MSQHGADELVTQTERGEAAVDGRRSVRRRWRFSGCDRNGYMCLYCTRKRVLLRLGAHRRSVLRCAVILQPVDLLRQRRVKQGSGTAATLRITRCIWKGRTRMSRRIATIGILSHT